MEKAEQYLNILKSTYSQAEAIYKANHKIETAGVLERRKLYAI